MVATILKYGWYALLIAIIGEIIVPFALAPFYKGYNHQTIVISVLGNKNSPVKFLFRGWMLFAGVLLLISIPVIYTTYLGVSKLLTVIMTTFIFVFAVGACILSGFFSVNETKEIITTASKIHGIGSVLGFMVMLFVPLLLSLLNFKADEKQIAILSLVSFILSLLFFILFIMADKPEIQNVWIKKEGLWQRMNLFFMYLPLAYIALKNIVK